MSEIILNKENFEKEVVNSDKPILVDFWATWCGPCRMLAPVLSEIAEEYKDVVRVGKVNVDEEPELAGAFRISSIPTVMLFRDGELKDAFIGVRGKEQIVQMFSK